jgi:hypothetical protein
MLVAVADSQPATATPLRAGPVCAMVPRPPTITIDVAQARPCSSPVVTSAHDPGPSSGAPGSWATPDDREGRLTGVAPEPRSPDGIGDPVRPRGTSAEARPPDLLRGQEPGSKYSQAGIVPRATCNALRRPGSTVATLFPSLSSAVVSVGVVSVGPKETRELDEPKQD